MLSGSTLCRCQHTPWLIPSLSFNSFDGIVKELRACEVSRRGWWEAGKTRIVDSDLLALFSGLPLDGVLAFSLKKKKSLKKPYLPKEQ